MTCGHASPTRPAHRPRRRPRRVRGVRGRRAADRLPADRPDRHVAAWKAQVALPRPLRRGWSRSIRAATAARDRPIDPAAYGDPSSSADTVAVMDDLGIERAVLVGICTASGGRVLTAARHPERVSGDRRDGAVAAPFLHRRIRRGRHGTFDDVPDTAGLGEGQPALLAQGLPGLPRVLLRRAAPRAALDQAVGGLRRLGTAEHRRRRCSPPTTRRGRRDAAEDVARAGSRGSHARCSSSTGDEDRCQPPSARRSSPS